jgi:hypothetical protein
MLANIPHKGGYHIFQGLSAVHNTFHFKSRHGQSPLHLRALQGQIKVIL